MVLFQILCLVHYLLDRWIHVHEVCAAGRGCGDNPPLRILERIATVNTCKSSSLFHC